MRIRSNTGVIDIIAHLLIWLILCVITFGIALFFYPYYFARLIINRSEIIDDNGVAHRMQCNTDIFSNIGHIILWIIISIITLGLGYLFYFYKVWNYSLNNTVIE